MGGRGSAGQRSNSLSDYEIGKTLKVGKYKIDEGIVTSPSGRSSRVESFSELSASDKKKYEQMGVSDPVKSGRMILPRNVAEASIKQVSYQKELMRKNVPGLDELRKARAYDESQREAFKRSVYSGSGRIQGSSSSQTAAALSVRYPRAAAYLQAESVSYSNDYRRAAIGKKAKYAIANGESYKRVISNMKKELDKLTKRNMRD